MSKIILLCCILIYNQPYLSKSPSVVPSAASLNKAWNNAWNKKDSLAVSNMISESAILADGKMEMNGKTKIADLFIHRFIGKIADIKSVPVKLGSDKMVCYYSGLYSFTRISDGKLSVKESGRYTFIWEKQVDGIFRLTVMHMQEYK